MAKLYKRYVIHGHNLDFFCFLVDIIIKLVFCGNFIEIIRALIIEQTTIVVPLSIHLTILCFLNEMPQSSLIHFRITTFVESHIVSTNALIKIGKERKLSPYTSLFQSQLYIWIELETSCAHWWKYLVTSISHKPEFFKSANTFFI